MENGLLMIYVGANQRSSISPLGQVLRALGRGFRVCVIHFVRGFHAFSESALMDGLKGRVEFFTPEENQSEELTLTERNRSMAGQAWQTAQQMILSGRYKIVVLDHLTDRMSDNMLDTAEVVEFLSNRPRGVNVLITGTSAPEPLVEIADLVTEVKQVKPAQKSA